MSGLLIFLMLYSVDVDKKHQVVAFKLTLKAIFDKIDKIRPNFIVIDKNKIEYNIYIYIIDRNKVFCDNSEIDRI